LGGEKIREKMNILKRAHREGVIPGTFPTTPGIYRKLVHFPDMEGKTRVVAELDY